MRFHSGCIVRICVCVSRILSHSFMGSIPSSGTPQKEREREREASIQKREETTQQRFKDLDFLVKGVVRSRHAVAVKGQSIRLLFGRKHGFMVTRYF